MNRRQFMKEMQNGLWETTKELFAPFAKEKVQRLEDTMQAWEGVRYYEAASPFSLSFDVQTVKVKNKLFFIEGLNAYEAHCPGCGSFLHIMNGTVRCFLCDTARSLRTKEGDVALREVPMKLHDRTLYIGIKE